MYWEFGTDINRFAHEIYPWYLLQQASETVDPLETERKNTEVQEELMRQQLVAKQKELLTIQQKRLELELVEAEAKIAAQKKALQMKEVQVRVV